MCIYCVVMVNELGHQTKTLALYHKNDLYIYIYIYVYILNSFELVHYTENKIIFLVPTNFRN